MAFNDYFQKKYFNPLSHFFETEKKTHARTRRTSFIQKCADTWRMWSGIPSIQRKHFAAKAGLLDYPMLHIPFLVGFIKGKLLDLFLKHVIGKTPWRVPFIIFLGPLLLLTIAIDFGFDLIKQALGLLITIASLPFIGIVQGITLLATRKEKKQLQEDIKKDLEQRIDENENKEDDLKEKEILIKKQITNIHIIKKEDNDHVYLKLRRRGANRLVALSETELTTKERTLQYPTYILTEKALYYKQSKNKNLVTLQDGKENIEQIHQVFTCTFIKMSDQAFEQEIKNPHIELHKMSSEAVNQIKEKPKNPRYILVDNTESDDDMDSELLYQGLDDQEPHQLLHITRNKEAITSLTKYFREVNEITPLTQIPLKKIRSLTPTIKNNVMDSPQYFLTESALYYKASENARPVPVSKDQNLLNTLQEQFKDINNKTLIPKTLSFDELNTIKKLTQDQSINIYKPFSEAQSSLLKVYDCSEEGAEKAYTIPDFKKTPYYFFNFGHNGKDGVLGAAEQFEKLFSQESSEQQEDDLQKNKDIKI